MFGLKLPEEQNFNQYVTASGFSQSTIDAFRSWLDNLANGQRTEKQWDNLFVEWRNGQADLAGKLDSERS